MQPTGETPMESATGSNTDEKARSEKAAKTRASPSETPSLPTPPSFTFEPTSQGSWIRPRYAAVVVSIVAVALLGVVAFALLELTVGQDANHASIADPNASTIAAIASAAIACLTSLTAAYFGVKVASEQSAHANATAGMALEVASKAAANSTTNGNPEPTDF